jgi:hypothetical protein
MPVCFWDFLNTQKASDIPATQNAPSLLQKRSKGGAAGGSIGPI